jgi:hypothetical protein
MEFKKIYKASGLVYGRYWGGGSGSYPSQKYSSDSLEELTEKLNSDLKGGRLDSGMGFESLIGALISIETIESVEINGKIYSNSDTEEIYIGELNHEQMDFLEEVYYENY